jgi:hypothetical protein
MLLQVSNLIEFKVILEDLALANNTIASSGQNFQNVNLGNGGII